MAVRWQGWGSATDMHCERSASIPPSPCLCRVLMVCDCMQVDAFAVYSITLVGGRHVTQPTFVAADVLAAIGELGRGLLLACPLPALFLEKTRPLRCRTGS